MGTRTLEELAREAAAGDPHALSRLVDEVQHPVYRLALRFLGDPEDAKDASQEILIRLITNLGSFEGRSQFMTWAYSVAVRQLMRTRKRQLEASVKGAETFAAHLDSGLADRDFTAEEAEYRLLSAEVRIGCAYGMLLCLSRPLRASYILGDAMGMPDTVAAEICGISRAAHRVPTAAPSRRARSSAPPSNSTSPSPWARSTARTRASRPPTRSGSASRPPAPTCWRNARWTRSRARPY